jgi:hypothetical protein
MEVVLLTIIDDSFDVSPEVLPLFGCVFMVIYLLLTLIFACCCNRMTMINYDDGEYGILTLLL